MVLQLALCCAVLRWAALCCAALCCALCCAALCGAVLRSAALGCTALCCAVLRGAVLCFAELRCFMLASIKCAVFTTPRLHYLFLLTVSLYGVFWVVCCNTGIVFLQDIIYLILFCVSVTHYLVCSLVCFSVFYFSERFSEISAYWLFSVIPPRS